MELEKNQYKPQPSADEYMGPGAEVATSASIYKAVNAKQKEHCFSGIDVHDYFLSNLAFPVSVASVESDNSFSIHKNFDYTDFCEPIP